MRPFTISKATAAPSTKAALPPQMEGMWCNPLHGDHINSCRVLRLLPYHPSTCCHAMSPPKWRVCGAISMEEIAPEEIRAISK
ncbi:hypothetical protein Q3G72_009442 [Acer saccharum]|nr:hypothetical protein Q3G72_009442 [Acer saccharum]